MQINQTAKNLSEPIIASITEIEVLKLMNLRESKAFIKKRLEQIDCDLAALEDDIIVRIESGARIESPHPICVKITERRYPSWKDAFITVAGELEAKKVIDSTTPTISKSIVISTK